MNCSDYPFERVVYGEHCASSKANRSADAHTFKSHLLGLLVLCDASPVPFGADRLGGFPLF